MLPTLHPAVAGARMAFPLLCGVINCPETVLINLYEICVLLSKRCASGKAWVYQWEAGSGGWT